MKRLSGYGLAGVFGALALALAACTPASDEAESEDAGGTGGAAGQETGGTGGGETGGAAGQETGGTGGGDTGGAAGVGGEAGAGGAAGTGGEAGAGGAAGTGGEAGTGGGAGTGGVGGGGPGTWEEAATPCPGSRTNAMWFDDRQNGFVGCGENADGYGLFSTTDGGETWDTNVKFEQARVMNLRRAPDGKLYGAGKDTLDNYSAWQIDEATATLKLIGLFEPGNNAFTKVDQGENIAVAEDGQMLVDSLTGNSAAYKPASGTFTELENLNEASIADPDNAPNFQVRRVVAFDNKFYATGSTISEPAQVFLPSKLAGATYHLQPLELQPSTRSGELIDIHIWSATKMIVVGWDNSTDYPLIYRVDGADPYLKASWTQIELLDSGIDYKGGIWAISVDGDTIVAAGEKIPTSEGGFVLRSTDGGLTWEDISPSDGGLPPGPLSKIWLFANGDVFAAGGGQEAWVLTH